MKFVLNDGGRAAAGFKGRTGDCVTRAISIATGMDYTTVYQSLNSEAGKPVARTGVPKKISKAYMAKLGWDWVPTMGIGTGCRVHLRPGDLPASGRLIVCLSRHWVAVIDGEVHDTYDPTRAGGRCVYGYYKKKCG